MQTLLSLLLLIELLLSPGRASYYDDGPGLYAAVHSYRFGDPTYSVNVCRVDHPSVCVLVTVRDYMASTSKVIDLGPDAFVRLWPGESRANALSHGVAQVTVSDYSLPPTDTQ